MLCWPLERRIGLVCRQTFSWILQLFFYLLYFLSIFFLTHDVLPTPTTHTHTHFPLPMTHHMNILVTLRLNWNNYCKLKEPFLPRPQKMQVRISTCALYMYLIHFICFGFFSKVRATVYNTRLTANISKLKVARLDFFGGVPPKFGH